MRNHPISPMGKREKALVGFYVLAILASVVVIWVEFRAWMLAPAMARLDAICAAVQCEVGPDDRE